MTRLIVVGACYADTILSVPYYPTEDAKLRATSLVRRRGGNGPNALEVLQQLVKSNTADLSLSLCCVLPSEDSSAVKDVRLSLGEKVDFSLCIYRPEYTEAASSYIIRSQAAGSRTIVNYNELPEMKVEELTSLAEKVKHEICWFHFEGRIPDTTSEFIAHLRKFHPVATVSVEVEKPRRPGLQRLAAQADVVFYSKTWAQNEGYQSARECLDAQSAVTRKPFLLCCTWGQDGASVFDRRSGRSEQVPAFLPEAGKAIDSTGAGDTFTAGVLYCLLVHPNIDLRSMLEFAVKLAGCKVAQEGFSGLDRVSIVPRTD